MVTLNLMELVTTLNKAAILSPHARRSQEGRSQEGRT